MSTTEATHDSAADVQHDKIKPFTLRVYVPETVPDAVLQASKRILARNHGGYTAFQSRGGWVDDSGELVEETTTVLEVAVSTLESRFESPAQYADHWAGWLKANSDETVVMTEMRDVDVITQ